MKRRNPFISTKAVDFTDEEINQYWVDLSDAEGESVFEGVLSPNDPMPIILLGGKGSGKTHLLRHISLESRMLADGNEDTRLAQLIGNDGYIGIYARLTGLNNARFSGKGISASIWNEVYSYYFELWLAEVVLSYLVRLSSHFKKFDEEQLVTEVEALFDKNIQLEYKTIADLLTYLKTVRKSIDYEVNNASSSGEIKFDITCSPATLANGLPRVISKMVSELSSIRFTYILDELENLDEEKQVIVNNLIREREDPCTYRIGAKLWGHRTLQCYGGSEQLVNGAEYRRVELDDIMRGVPEKNYNEFSATLVFKRLAMSGEIPESQFLSRNGNLSNWVSGYFEDFYSDEVAHKIDTSFLGERKEYKHLAKFRKYLEWMEKRAEITERQGSELLVSVKRTKDLLEQKAAIHIVYQGLFGRRKNPDDIIDQLRRERDESGSRPRKKDRRSEILKYYKYDFFAQICRDYGQVNRQYIGFLSYVRMSRGLPRHLLILLRNVTQWAYFLGEEPFGLKPISVDAQIKGIQDSAEWFYRDAFPPSEIADDVRLFVDRIGNLLSALRYSDKPAECSLSTFSFDPEGLTKEKGRLIRAAQEWSLLIPIQQGHREKNTGKREEKVWVNPMLAPIWGLSTTVRGTLQIASEDFQRILDVGDAEGFNEVMNKLVNRWSPLEAGETSTSKQPRLI